MDQPSVFAFNSYKKALSHFLLKQGKRGRLSRAAEMLNCRPSFLSRVIGTEIHLTPDQAFMICKFMKWNEDESAYFQSLVAFERAAEPQYKSSLAKRISTLKSEQESLQKRIERREFSESEQEAAYFSSWHWSAIHFLVSIPKYQSVSAISKRLCLSEAIVVGVLKRLENYGLVQQNSERWEYARGEFHVPKHSPFVVLHHQNWRHRAVLDAQNAENDSIHFSVVQTLSLSDLERLKELMLQFISDSNTLARPSQPEEMVAITCDLFKV